ncbi:membrane bound O-acyl transferase family-domain-containing protein [Suillus clintonianus]|uniref:membrane bound O-acyl transferase family-domain-containing protein n=1 Tax=Suillus clintonianus TaxID=1904413 RepID=UPI001B879FE3|nr:membrane bound O-acyl transferase family-domain-containing protein [Suillus clintonianus]KAG2145201.1 membrane bound O-acyl transferase family-domain-containing protein [Suillus clintonianus]
MRVTPYIIIIQLPLITLQILLLLNPSPPWNLFGALALALICSLIISPSVFVSLNIDTGIGYVDYMLGSTIACYAMNSFYLLLLGRPLENFTIEDKGNEKVHKSWWKRILHVAHVMQSPRGVGWNYQVKNVPAAPRQPRHLFVLSSTLRAVCHAILFEVARLYVWYNPAFSSPTVEIQTRSYVARCADTTAFIGLTYWGLNAGYFAIAAGSVALGLNEPRMWPDLFGSWRDAYTIRRAWGRTWHQTLKWFLAPLGKATSSVLGFKRGTSGSSYAQIYVAFLFSGLVHTGGDIALSGSSTSAAPRPFFSLPFFLSQAVVITLEDAFIRIARRLGVKDSIWTRALGFVWVAVWFGLCVPQFVENMIRAGGGIRKSASGMGGNDLGPNLVQTAMVGLFGFDIGEFAESWFAKGMN